MDPPISLDTLEFPHFRVGQIAVLLNEFHGFLMKPSLLLNEFDVFMLNYVDLCWFMLFYVDLCWFMVIWLQNSVFSIPELTFPDSGIAFSRFRNWVFSIPKLICLNSGMDFPELHNSGIEFSRFRNWVFWMQEWIFLNYIIPEFCFVNSWMEFLFGRGGGWD